MMKFKVQFYISLIILISFCSGYLLAHRLQRRSHYLTAIEFLHRMRTFPVGKLRTAGTYYVQLPGGQGLMQLTIDKDPQSGVVKSVSLSGRDVLFWYNASNRYGMPLASLTTGEGKQQTTWVDIGLKGRFVEKYGPGVRLYRRIQGKWVSLFRRMRPTRGTEFYFKGSLYGYDRTTGDWELVKARKR